MEQPVYTPPPVTGYRQLTQQEVDWMNRAKEKANDVGSFLKELEELPAQAGIDRRWLAIAKTDLQKAFMCLVRSIAKPDSF